jgi:iron-sulfur cluster assembly protein
MFDVSCPVTISEKAVKEISRIISTKNIPPDYGLRVGVKGGGCGVSLLIGFDKQKESDQVYSISNLTVLVDKKHTMYVIGKEVDFYEGDSGHGFVFVNNDSQQNNH